MVQHNCGEVPVVDTPLRAVARLMVQHNCGEIPVVDADGQLIGVVTDRDIVCRVLAAGKNPLEHTVQDCMSQPAITCISTRRSPA